MRRVVVSGVCGGIGRATARAFTELGWRVIGVDCREPDSGVAVDRFERADLGADDDAATLFIRLSDEGSLTALVNNAAIGLDKCLA